MSLEQMYTLEEVAESLRCSKRFLKDRIKSGLITPMRLGDADNAPIRLSADDVTKLRESMTPVKAKPRRRGRALA